MKNKKRNIKLIKTKFLSIILRRKIFKGVVINIFCQSIWFDLDGIEITLSKPTYKNMYYWWKKIDILYNPFEIDIYNNL